MAWLPQYGHSWMAVVASDVSCAPHDEHRYVRMPARSSSFQLARERYEAMELSAWAPTATAASMTSSVTTDDAPAASSAMRSKLDCSPASARAAAASAFSSASRCLAAYASSTWAGVNVDSQNSHSSMPLSPL